MAKLPEPFYAGLQPIEAALSEGRNYHARILVAEALKAGAERPEEAFALIKEALDALSEGRTEDVHWLLVMALSVPTTSPKIQHLAADMLTRPKRGRGRPSKTYPELWIEIGEYINLLRSDGHSRESAIQEAVDHFGYGETHVKTCLKIYDEGKRAGQ